MLQRDAAESRANASAELAAVSPTGGDIGRALLAERVSRLNEAKAREQEIAVARHRRASLVRNLQEGDTQAPPIPGRFVAGRSSAGGLMSPPGRPVTDGRRSLVAKVSEEQGEILL